MSGLPRRLPYTLIVGLPAAGFRVQAGKWRCPVCRRLPEHDYQPFVVGRTRYNMFVYRCPRCGRTAIEWPRPEDEAAWFA